MSKPTVTLFPSEIIEIAENANSLDEVFRLERSGKDDKKAIYRNFQIKHPKQGWIPVIIQVFELNTVGGGIPPPGDQKKREHIGTISISFTDKSSYVKYDGSIEDFGRACMVLHEAQDFLLEKARKFEDIPAKFLNYDRSAIAVENKEGDGYWISIKIPVVSSKGNPATEDSKLKCDVMDGQKRLRPPVNGKHFETATVKGEPLTCGNVHEFIKAGSIILMGTFNFSVVYMGNAWIASKGKIDSCVVLPPPSKKSTINDCNQDQLAYILDKEIDIEVVEQSDEEPSDVVDGETLDTDQVYDFEL